MRAEHDPCIHRALPDGFHYGTLSAEFDDFKIFVRVYSRFFQSSAEDHVAGGELAESDPRSFEIRKIPELARIFRSDDDCLSANHHTAENRKIDPSGDEKQRRRRSERAHVKFLRPDSGTAFSGGVELKQIGVNPFFSEKAFLPGDEVQSVRRFRQIADPDFICGEHSRCCECQNCGKCDFENVVHTKTPS